MGYLYLYTRLCFASFASAACENTNRVKSLCVFWTLDFLGFALAADCCITYLYYLVLQRSAVSSLILADWPLHITLYIISSDPPLSWWRGTVVERRSLAGELSLSCARPAADG